MTVTPSINTSSPSSPIIANLKRPILRGRDLKKGTIKTNSWLICTHNGYNDNSPIDINNYASLKYYLQSFGDRLTDRADKGYTPFNLRSCDYWEDFSKPKIFWKAVGKRLGFIYEKDEIYISAPSCFLNPGAHDKLIYYFLRSEYAKYFFYKYGENTGVGDLMLNIQSLKELLLPQKDIEQIELAVKTQDLNLVNQTIYSRFGFDQKEIEYIKNFDL